MTDVRITVRLTTKEAAQLDELVVAMGEASRAAYRERRWNEGPQRPHAHGRHHSWNRGDVVRQALAELYVATKASDEPLEESVLTGPTSKTSDAAAIAVASDGAPAG